MINGNQKYHLTASQQQMWVAHHLNPDSSALNVVHTFTILNGVDRQVFEASFMELQRQVSVFRCVFGTKNSIPYQEVKPVPIRGLDWIELGGGGQEEAKTQADHRKQKPFLLKECVFDACMFQIGENQHLFYLNMHHIITDATSTTLLWKALWTLYFGFKEEGAFPKLGLLPFEESLPPFGEAPPETHAGPLKEHHLKGKGQSFYGHRAQGSSKSVQIRVPLGDDRLQKMKALMELPGYSSLSEEMGLYHILLTVYVAFLSRITESDTVCMGIPVHHRSALRARRSPGLWIEFYPYEAEVSGYTSFKQLYHLIISKSFEFFKNALPGSSSAEANRYNHAIFNFISTGFEHPEGWEVDSQWVHPGESDPSHIIRCHFSKLNISGEPQIWFDLNDKVFPRAIQKRLPEHFLILLDAFLMDQEKSFKEIALETSFTLEKEYPIPELPGARARSFAGQSYKTAIVEGATSYTYGQLHQAMDSIALILEDMGLQEGDRIGLYFNRSALYVAAVWTCLREGFVFIPLDPGQPGNRLDFMARDAHLSVILSGPKSRESGVWRMEVPTIGLDHSIFTKVEKRPIPKARTVAASQPAYMLYTSGSSGYPKGVLIDQEAISHYVSWAAMHYKPAAAQLCMPFFTSIGFDLTLTSLLTPLYSGGQLIVIPEDKEAADLSVLELVKYPGINTVKLTPSHLKIFLAQGKLPENLESCILGGEDLPHALAHTLFSRGVQRIYNEYGPTEASVGCIVAQYDPRIHMSGSIPIGRPVPYASYILLDDHLNQVPTGTLGEIYLYGPNLAIEYWGQPELSAERFIEHPQHQGLRLYKTGDYARMTSAGELIFKGRKDEQIKRNGYRIELGEIENAIVSQEGIKEVAVVFDPGDTSKVALKKGSDKAPEHFCTNCGLPSNYPKADFDEAGICHLCRAFEGYESRVAKYFKTESDLERLLKSKKGRSPHYDCLTLLSGGKDSTYVLARLVGMGLRVLAFTLDNGYISDQAKTNIDKVVKDLGVDHVYGSTPHMNAIFVDSLKRHQNVCNGCFKTIYTLSTKLALKKDIPFVVTGLSRGQFFETRLTEELFWQEDTSIESIDKIILEARKLYHQEQDAVKNCLDVSMFNDATTFERVEYVDFYRYSQVSLQELLTYLREEIGWERPSDTGRSTNCLINQAGIYVHKKEKGYSNYAFPYSWDVRLGHKEREESLEEINEEIDEKEVLQMLDEIGYVGQDEHNGGGRLLAFYSADGAVDNRLLQARLSEHLPLYMLPTDLVAVDRIPLTDRGKIARSELLEKYTETHADTIMDSRQPENDIQEMLQQIWEKVLSVETPGIENEFIQLGGHSLAAIRVTAQLNELLETELPLNWVFKYPTIRAYSEALESYMRSILEKEKP